MKKLLLSTLLLSMAVAGVSAQTYCTPQGTISRSDRYVNYIQIAGPAQTLKIEDFTKTSNRPVYYDRTSNVISCAPGDILTVTYSIEGTWMHKYVYVDWNNNGTFDVTDGTPGVTTDWGELVSANYLAETDVEGQNGYTSAGTTGAREGTTPLPSFTVPAGITSGDYRARFKYDWYNTDACPTTSGNNSILSNGGAVIDFTVRIENRTSAPVISLASGSGIQKGITEIPVSCATEGAIIYYTVDGTEPTESSEQAPNGIITIDAIAYDYETVVTVKAVAKAEGKDMSSVVTVTYTVKDAYGLFCTPAATSTGNKRAQSKGEILNPVGVVDGSTLVFTPSGSSSSQAWSNSDDMVRVEPGATFDLKVTYGLGGWNSLSIYQMKSSSDYTLIYGAYEGSWVSGGSTATLFTNINNANDAATADASAGTATFPITIPDDLSEGDLVVVRFINHGGESISTPCATGVGELNYCDYVFYVEAPQPVIPTEDKEITASESETGDAAYLTVTVKAGDATAAAPVWSIGANTVTAQALNIEVAADATTPEISISDGGSITADRISVKRTVKADEWAFMSLPFAITVDNGSIQVGGAAAVINDNIKFLVYDGALRASSSIELFSGSGWTAKESGTIDANTGFAVAINSNNGDEQVVTFSATSFSMDASDKAVSLESHEATVNGGIDADWNFKGNPMLQSASKDEGYSLYIYNPSDDTYSEYAAAETATFSPFAAWFVQSTGLTNRTITFSHDGTTVAADAESNIDGRFAISINGGEDEARITVLNGSSESYVINEDAMYFAPNSNKVAQVYMIDGDGAKIASSVVPAPYDEVKLAYNAAVAGAQTLTVTSVIPGTAVYLVDNEEGTETLMNEGSEYNFTSAAGLNSERFAVKTIIDVTGIEENTAETSSVSAVVAGDAVKIYGATAGETIDVYTVNGVLVSSAVAVEGENEISVPTQGVLIVKVGDEVVKIVK